MSLAPNHLDRLHEAMAARALRREETPSLRLSELSVGEMAVLGAPDVVDATIVRLLEMGMTAGAQVQLTRRSPWADPLEVSLRGTRLCLRRKDAERFPIRLLSSSR